MKPGERATKTELRQRVNEVLQMRLAGAEFYDIAQHAEENGWGVGARQLWRYITEADARLDCILEKDREKLVKRHLAQRHALYARCIAVADYRTCLAILKDEGEMLGLYAAKKHEITGKDGSALGEGVVVYVPENNRDTKQPAEQDGDGDGDGEGKA